ncbi:MAG TPA: DUF4232 domain-containing protein [Streptomyces sp.]|nr:DUF4232 domain-containing protein [Streptomyces sp.]
MTRTARPRRTAAALAAASLGLLALTACDGGSGKDKAVPGASASPSTVGKGKGSGAPSTAGPGGGGAGEGASASGGGGGGGTKAPSDAGAGDDQDGGVGMCETTDLTYTVTVASKPAGHALLTAANTGGDPCLLAVNDVVITIPALDGAAGHRGPDGEDRILEPGEKAYAGILFAAADSGGGKSADKAEIALTASESPTTVPIGGGPVTVDDPQVTSFFGTAEDALTY